MAIQARITTIFGEERDCYIRLNNIEASNHGQPAQALFRAFLGRAAFEAGHHYVAELPVEFAADVSRPLWGQAYDALKERLPDAADADDAAT